MCLVSAQNTRKTDLLLFEIWRKDLQGPKNAQKMRRPGVGITFCVVGFPSSVGDEYPGDSQTSLRRSTRYEYMYFRRYPPPT